MIYLENIEIEIKQELNEMSLSRENLSSGVCDQERHKPACRAIEAS